MKNIAILLFLYFGLGLFSETYGQEIDSVLASNAGHFFASQKWDTPVLVKMDRLFDPVSNEMIAYLFTYRFDTSAISFDDYVKDVQFIYNRDLNRKSIEGIYPVDENQNRIIAKTMRQVKEVFGSIVIASKRSLPPMISRQQGIHPVYVSRQANMDHFYQYLGHDNFTFSKYYLLNFLNFGIGYTVNSNEFIVDDNLNVTKLEGLSRIKKTTLYKIHNNIIENRNKKAWKFISKKLSGREKSIPNEHNKIYQDLSINQIVGEKILPDVPHYNQNNFGASTCGPVACSAILGYWDDLFPNLIDWGNNSFADNPRGVRQAIEDLKVTVKWDGVEGTGNWKIAPGVRKFCNNSDYYNNLNFSVDWDLIIRWSKIKENIDELHPLVLQTMGEFHESDGTKHNWNHYMPVYGYIEYESPVQRIALCHTLDWGLNDIELNLDLPHDNIDLFYFFPEGEDNVKPSFELSFVNTKDVYTGNIPLNISTSDQSGIALVQIEYSVNGNIWIELPSLENYSYGDFGLCYLFNSYEINYSTNVLIRGYSIDNWGNFSGIESLIPITVDNRGEQPNSIISTISLNPSSTTPNSSVTVTGTVFYDTNEPVVGSVEITAGSNNWTANLDNGNYSKNIYSPSSSGYVTVHVTDGRLESNSKTYLTIINGGNGDNFEFYRSTMCQDVQAYDPYNPIDETHWFRSDDDRAYCWIHLKNLYVPVKHRWNWFTPDGEEVLDPVYTDYSDDPGNGYYYDWWKHWYGYNIKGEGQSDREGRHSVKIYSKEYGGNWEYMESQYYIISYDFKEHQLCKDIQADYPVTSTNEFVQNDNRAITWTLYTDVSEPIETRTEWYEPNGSKYFTHDYTTDDPGHGYYYPEMRQWSWINVDNELAESKCGLWKVKKYEKNPFGQWDHLYTEEFVIKENPNQSPSISAAINPDNVYEGTNILLNLTASDNTYLKKVSVHWETSSSNDDEWTDIFASTFSQTVNLGNFIEGDQISFYAKSYDTSGNVNETQRKTLIVNDSDTQGPVVENVTILESNGNQNGLIEHNEEIIISCNISDVSGIGEYQFFIDDQPVIATGEYFAICGPYGSGSHSVKITTSDSDISPASTTVYGIFIVEEDQIKQTINLNYGWNLFSFNVIPENMDLLNIVQPLINEEKLIKIIDEKGNIIENMPWGWVNNIGNMANTEGYYIKISSNGSLDLSGEIVDCPYTTDMITGWNMIGYPCQNQQNAMIPLQQLIDNDKLLKVIDEKGNIIQKMPWGLVNNIEDFAPGEGYYIKLSEDGSIQFEEPIEPLVLKDNGKFVNIPQTMFFEKVQSGNPYMPMTIILTDLDNIINGSEVGIFDGDLCVGAGKIINDKLFISASADDPSTPIIDGFINGNTITIKVFNYLFEYVNIVKPEQIKGKLRFSPLETYAGSLKSYTINSNSGLLNNYLGQNFPNPTSYITTIEYGLFEASSIKLIVYDQLGKIVKLIHKPDKLPGKHHISIDCSEMKKGIYYYRLETNGHSGYFTKTRKMIVK